MPRVIIADDSLVSRTVLGYMVGRAGHHVVAEAKDGAEALTRVVECRPDLAFIDVVMKGSDGLDVIARIRSAHPEVKLIAVTDVGQDEERRRAEGLGVDGVLRKPFVLQEVEDLLDVIFPQPLLQKQGNSVEIH